MADAGSAATSALATAIASATAAATSGADDDTPGNCVTSNDYNGMLGVRISAVFVILVGSMLGSVFPVWARANKGVKIPNWPFFVAKYFGSGVIVATAFIHLLAPATDALTDPCLTGPITEYDWAEGIALMSVFVLFFVELLAMRFSVFDPHGHGHDHPVREALVTEGSENVENKRSNSPDISQSPHVPHSVDHLGHARSHTDPDAEAGRAGDLSTNMSIEDFSAQMTAIFILEFGIIFHSIFVGLTLAVAGDEFTTLYIVIVFHQTFEGLGLGARLANAPWPKNRWWTPYLLGAGYAFSTPISIAIGLGVRETYAPGSQTSLVVNGVFDSISAGILIYTGLVELMAHEFMFSDTMRKAPLREMLSAFGLMVLGAGLMALLGEWA